VAAASGIRRIAPDLARLPIVVDRGALNIAEGLRAALSTATLIAASAWLNEPLLIESALAALLVCLCDTGGPIRRRVPALLIFTVVGALIVVFGPLARGAGVFVGLPFGALLIFCGAFVRIYGLQAQQVGMFLCVLVIFALDRAMPLDVTMTLGGAFLIGGLWATLMTMALWRVYPFQPVRRSLGGAYTTLAELAQGLQSLLAANEIDPAAWETRARADRARVRTAIELARTKILETIRSRGPIGSRAAQSLLRLETADQLFGAMIALSDLLETATESERTAAAHMIRRLRPLLVVLGHEMLVDRTGAPKPAHAQIDRSITAMAKDITVLPEGNHLRELVSAIVTRLRVVQTVSTTGDSPVDSGPGARPPRMWETLRTPILANLSWQSLPFRHALRAAVTTAPALVYTLLHHQPFDHWLTITILVTMQPYFGNTFTRALERVAGTTFGGLLAAAIGLYIATPLGIAVAMFPLAIFAFTIRAVSFGLFVSALTPMIVLLVEFSEPGTSDLLIAGQRVLLTLAGGVTAIAGCYLLWPSWEPSRLVAEVRAAIAAHAGYAEAELSMLLGEATSAEVGQARRAAGLATNNVEASVARALLEPGSAHNHRLEAAMVIDAALRRLAGRLTAMQFDPGQKDALPLEEWRHWRNWLSNAMRGLAAGNHDIAPHPELGETIHTEALGRIARQIELIAGTIARVSA
jgi:uncharacterized membrane protein YccC